MNVRGTLTTALNTATTLLVATSATAMVDILWTLMICTPAMVCTDVYVCVVSENFAIRACECVYIFLPSVLYTCSIYIHLYTFAHLKEK